jgi:glycosyltransferase involved in cell wall biosynthesis/SAM-dependent methyltransferase
MRVARDACGPLQHDDVSIVNFRMRLLFVTHYFYPEVGAAQTRILETARLLRRRGHEVTVLTGFPNYPDGVIPAAYRGRVAMRERIDDISIVRTPVYPAPNRGFGRRLLNHLSFALSSVAGAPASGAADVVIAETPPLFTAVSAVAIAALKRVPLVLNVADLWPESAVQLGLLSNPHAIRAAELLERLSYDHANVVCVPTPGMRSILLGRGEPPEKVVHLPNAVDVDRFAAAADSVPVRGRVIYSGTVGLAQGVATLVEAGALLKEDADRPEILIVGDGAERADLARRAADEGLDHVRFAGRVDRDAIPALIGSAEMAVMSLRDLPIFDDALPTKLLEYMAAARPVVAAASGQVARLVREVDAGIACPPEDARALADAIRAVAADPVRAREMGQNGRRHVEAHLSRDAFVDRLEEILATATAEEPEQARIERVFGRYYASGGRSSAWSATNRGNRTIASRSSESVEAALRKAGRFPDGERRLLEVGCGTGALFAWLIARGATPANLHGLDLLADRIVEAQRALPLAVDLRVADGRAVPMPACSVDAVVMSTVLSSIPNPHHRATLAREALRILRPGGIVVIYDVRFPNPLNGDLRAMTKRELQRLFEGYPLEARALTVLPPLARRLGRATDAVYPLLERVPPLRTHLVAVVGPV